MKSVFAVVGLGLIAFGVDVDSVQAQELEGLQSHLPDYQLDGFSPEWQRVLGDGEYTFGFRSERFAVSPTLMDEAVIHQMAVLQAYADHIEQSGSAQRQPVSRAFARATRYALSKDSQAARLEVNGGLFTLDDGLFRYQVEGCRSDDSAYLHDWVLTESGLFVRTISRGSGRPDFEDARVQIEPHRLIESCIPPTVGNFETAVRRLGVIAEVVGVRLPWREPGVDVSGTYRLELLSNVKMSSELLARFSDGGIVAPNAAHVLGGALIVNVHRLGPMRHWVVEEIWEDIAGTRSAIARLVWAEGLGLEFEQEIFLPLPEPVTFAKHGCSAWRRGARGMRGLRIEPNVEETDLVVDLR